MSLDFQQRAKWETHSFRLAPSITKKLLGPFVTCGHTRFRTHFGSSARPCPMAFPSQGTAKSRLPPADGPFLYTILQYSSSRLNANPFVIQPFNFFQMFPNKQRNKMKRELFFHNKSKWTKTFPACKTMPELAVGGWGWGQEREAGTLVSYL